MPDFGPLLAQMPVVALVLGICVWFTKQLRDERTACDKRESERDEQFLEVLERNTRAIESLGDAVRRS